MGDLCLVWGRRGALSLDAHGARVN
jgi:hypothetical protein